MERNYVVNTDELEVVDGRVMISSEELAAAIQNHELDLGAEEEADSITVNFYCPNSKKKK